MAFLDFLGNDVGGNQMAQGPNLYGQAGVRGAGATGLTYGDILGAALQYGGKPGSSGSAFGPLVAGQYGGQAQQNLLQGLPASGQQQQTGWQKLIPLILNIL